MSLYARPGAVALPVVPNRFTGVASRVLISVAVFGLPLLMAAARISEAPANLLGWSRLFVSVVAAGLIVLARRRDFAQRLLLAFLLEAASGIATFAYVDVPFVMGHTRSIAGSIAFVYAGVTHRDLRSDVRALPIWP